MSADRAHRLWRTSGLQVPRKRPRRRVASTRPRVPRASGPNQVWAYDFVFDACANDHQLECLTVIDEWSHERLVDVHVARRHFLRSASDVVGSSCLGRVIQVLARPVSIHGAPKYVRSDNGPEFVSRAVLRWLAQQPIEIAHIDLEGLGRTARTKAKAVVFAMSA